MTTHELKLLHKYCKDNHLIDNLTPQQADTMMTAIATTFGFAVYKLQLAFDDLAKAIGVEYSKLSLWQKIKLRTQVYIDKYFNRK